MSRFLDPKIRGIGKSSLSKISFLKKLDAVIGPLCVRLLSKCGATVSCSENIQKILLVRPGGIGDAVLLLPAIQALSEHYPTAVINVLAEKRNATVFDLCHEIDNVFCYDRGKDWFKFLPEKYDLIIDTEQWHYLSAIIVSLLRPHMSCGFSTNDRSLLFSQTVGYSHDTYEVDSFGHLIAAVGVDMPPWCGQTFLTIADDLACDARALLGVYADLPYVVFFPGASISERRWDESSFHVLACLCHENGIAVVVVGGGEDMEVGERIVMGCSGLNLAGKTSLAETAAILNGAQLLVSGDSGVLHLAAGVGCSTVALFGPGIIDKWAPRGMNHRVVSLELPCSPCTRFGTTPKCPDNGRCIKDISVDMVWQEVVALLNF